MGCVAAGLPPIRRRGDLQHPLLQPLPPSAHAVSDEYAPEFFSVNFVPPTATTDGDEAG